MKPPRLYKPAGRTQRFLSFILVFSFGMVLAAPFLGILGRELLVCAAICAGAFTVALCAKLAIHLYCSIRRFSIPAGEKNVDAIERFRKSSKDANNCVKRVLQNKKQLTWGHCIAISKQCHREAVKARLERFLEGLERLKII